MKILRRLQKLFARKASVDRSLNLPPETAVKIAELIALEKAVRDIESKRQRVGEAGLTLDEIVLTVGTFGNMCKARDRLIGEQKRVIAELLDAMKPVIFNLIVELEKREAVL